MWNSRLFFFFHFKGPSTQGLHTPFCLKWCTNTGKKAFCSLFICHFLASSHRPKRRKGVGVGGWVAGGKECQIQSSHHNSLQCMSGTWLIHRLLMAAHNQAPRLSTRGSGHTLKNPLEMSSPFQLSTLITLKQRVRGCFISFYAAMPVFAHSFLFVWFQWKGEQRALVCNSWKCVSWLPTFWGWDGRREGVGPNCRFHAQSTRKRWSED